MNNETLVFEYRFEESDLSQPANKLASIEIVSEIIKHPNADSLEIVKVLGYESIVPIGKFSKGEKIVYIWPDSILPDKQWAGFYKAKSSRVRAIKLRGVFSIGIVEKPESIGYSGTLIEGKEISKEIGIVKYETPLPTDIQAKSSILPFGISKTDEANYQSLNDKNKPYGDYVDITLKRDGFSVSIYYNLETDTWGITSRNMELKPEYENNYTRSVLKAVNISKLIDYCRINQVSLCLRGEAFGGGLNKHKFNEDAALPLSWELFNVWNIKERRYYNPQELFYFEQVSKDLGIPMVPILEKNVILTKEIEKHYSENVTLLSGKPFEGVVVKHRNGSFKIINKDYDSKK